MSIQVEQGETFVLDEINFVSHFDAGNLNPFAKEVGFSLQHIEIGTPFWEPEEDEEEELQSEPSQEPIEEPEPASEPSEDTAEPTEENVEGNDGAGQMPSLSGQDQPIKGGCNTAPSTDYLGLFRVFSFIMLFGWLIYMISTRFDLQSDRL